MNLARRSKFALVGIVVCLGLSFYIAEISVCWIHKRNVNAADQGNDFVTVSSASSLKRFLPIMSKTDKKLMLETLKVFIETCRRENLTYFLDSGSLLGAYRHHGMVPWDDDVDVTVVENNLTKIREVLSSVQGYVLYTPKNIAWKFYKTNLPPVPGKPFKYPFIDIFYYRQTSKEIIALTELNNLKVYQNSDIYPLQVRPFENLTVYVPCRMDKIILNSFGHEKCTSTWYLHKQCRSATAVTVPCRNLYERFPFVFRTSDPRSDNIIETLKVGQTTLSSVSVPKRCK